MNLCTMRENNLIFKNKVRIAANFKQALNYMNAELNLPLQQVVLKVIFGNFSAGRGYQSD